MSALRRFSSAFAAAVCAALTLIVASAGLSAQQAISVESAVPSVAELNTINLNVTIKGKGFKRGARAKFLVSGTDDTGGVTVNGTVYISSSELVANIDVADTAEVSTFDIEVANEDDRTGKGTELFSVVGPGINSAQAECTPLGSQDAPGFQLTGLLNDPNAAVPTYGERFGMNTKATKFDNGTREVMLLAVGTRNFTDFARIEIFHIDPATATRLDGVGSDPQPHVTLVAPIVDFGPSALAWGDFDANGAPDLVAGSQVSNAAYLFLGNVVDGKLTFSQEIPIQKPAGRTRFAWSVAAGDFDGNPLNGEEIAIGAGGGGSGKSAEPPRVFLYSYSGSAFILRRTLAPAGLKNDDGYGLTLAAGDVNGDGTLDLAAGVPNREVGSTADAGAVFVHPGPLLPVSSPEPAVITWTLTATTPVRNEMFGQDVAVGRVNTDGIADIVAGAETRALMFAGPVSSQPQVAVASYTMTPEAGLEEGWPGRDILIGNISSDPHADVVIGAPNASRSGACNSPGVTYAFLGTGTPAFTRFRLEAEEPNGGFAGYGWSVAGVDGFRVLAVGEHHRRINGIEAGQVYLYLVP